MGPKRTPGRRTGLATPRANGAKAARRVPVSPVSPALRLPLLGGCDPHPGIPPGRGGGGSPSDGTRPFTPPGARPQRWDMALRHTSCPSPGMGHSPSPHGVPVPRDGTWPSIAPGACPQRGDAALHPAGQAGSAPLGHPTPAGRGFTSGLAGPLGDCHRAARPGAAPLFST